MLLLSISRIKFGDSRRSICHSRNVLTRNDLRISELCRLESGLMQRVVAHLLQSTTGLLISFTSRDIL
jgi:hypothetical protein